jgi:hypothetical protein
MPPRAYETMKTRAAQIIERAESDLGGLTPGQRRDLLMDNTEWSYDVIKQIVADLPATERQLMQ